MTEINPAAWFQNRSDHSAAQLRLAIGGLLTHLDEGGASDPLLRPAGGVSPTAPMFVEQTSPATMQVRVHPGIAVVAGTENALQGAYICINDATKNLTIAASDPSLSRTDRVIARVRDQQYSGVTNAWALEIVTGTPGGGAPALPASSLEIARVTVGAGVTTILDANISFANRRFFSAAGGWEPWETQAAFDAMLPGGPYAHNWILDRTTLTHYYSAPGGSFDEFFTQRNGNRGYFQGKYYTGTGTLFSGTAEATVTNLDTGTITFPGGAVAVGGEVHCYVQSTVANDRVTFRVREGSVGGTSRGIAPDIVIPVANLPQLIEFNWMMPVVGGSANMVLTCQRATGSGTITVVGHANGPSWNLAKHYNTSGITVI